MGHVLAARARALYAAEAEDWPPEKLRAELQVIAEILAEHLHDSLAGEPVKTSDPYLPPWGKSGPGAVNAWLDAKKQERWTDRIPEMWELQAEAVEGMRRIFGTTESPG